MLKSKPKNILLGVTGSIAAYKAAALTSQLLKEGISVRVILTSSAQKFIGSATFEGLTGEPTWTDPFEAGRMMDHIALARWADALVVAPASANTISKFAHGAADDLLTTTFLALERDKPVYLAPAMNAEMWRNHAVQENVQTLTRRGIQILGPDAGALACGETGYGRMVEPEEIAKTLLATPSAPKGRILITFGGTREPIDSVRSITNTSTGQTGAALADFFFDQGYEVVCIAAKTAARPRSSLEVHEFSTFSDLAKVTEEVLAREDFDHIIHSAAVADFSVDNIETAQGFYSPTENIKLGTEKSISIHLKQNPKIVGKMMEWCRSKPKNLIAFKLTNTKDITQRDRAISTLLSTPGVSAVVHNDLNDISSDRSRHRFGIYTQKGAVTSCQGSTELGLALKTFFNQPEHRSKNNADDAPSFRFQLEVNHDSLS